MFLCKCNNCEGIFEDTNPQNGAPEFNIPYTIRELENHKCPICGVEDYLIDINENNQSIVPKLLMDNKYVTQRGFRLKVAKSGDFSRFPNFHVSGSISGMKNIYYGKHALLVKRGSFIYNVTSEPNIYFHL